MRGLSATLYSLTADTRVGRPLTDGGRRARYAIGMTISLFHTANFLIVAAGLSLAIVGMLRLSLPLIVAGAACWLLGIVLQERAAWYPSSHSLVERHALKLAADEQAQARYARVRDAVVRERPLAP